MTDVIIKAQIKFGITRSNERLLMFNYSHQYNSRLSTRALYSVFSVDSGLNAKDNANRYRYFNF